MGTIGKAMLVLIVATTLATVGCSKRMDVTIMNHTDAPLTVAVTVPDGTVPMGTVGAGGRLSQVVKIPMADLPATCSMSAGQERQSFTVTEDTQERLWFHISKKGSLSGPYNKGDVYTDQDVTSEIKARVSQDTIVE
ncbi:MAG: hypothetical protein WC869_09880 [Phycisphaerae bacterium]|jgi:hypothetical protein